MTALRQGSTTGRRRSWWFLGLVVDELTEDGAPTVVAEATLPEGASPPFHVHADLDDSFYVLEGKMVVRCGDEVSLATAGTWVQFPAGVPHTFRVLDGQARILNVHADDSFLGFVRDIGRPAVEGDSASTGEGPPMDELVRSMSEHGITTVGPPMEEDEARSWLAQLG